jgi:hypothetical protein
MRNQKQPNQRVNAVRAAHSTRNPLRGLLACYPRRSADAKQRNEGKGRCGSRVIKAQQDLNAQQPDGGKGNEDLSESEKYSAGPYSWLLQSRTRRSARPPNRGRVWVRVPQGVTPTG